MAHLLDLPVQPFLRGRIPGEPAQPSHGRRGVLALLGAGDAGRWESTAATASAALEAAASPVAAPL
ncbi:hypothetical protein XF36_21120 [Pseudonocardia sp. HH130629-09]|nr:hypothetical protein XF36_21120 [Pseudonocardia sp. HH130629-09]